MIIIGAKGFAKEVLEILHKAGNVENLVFYDDVNADLTGRLFDTFPILKSFEEAKHYFDTIDNRFTIGIGNPILRKKIYDKFTSIGGVYTSVISDTANLGSYGITIGEGANILPGVIVSNSVKIGIGGMIYYNAIITHDCEIGDFVEISPAATILGRCKIGSYTHIGANATILPDLVIGKNVTVGAGSVVTKDIPDNSVVAGVPATIKRTVMPTEF